MGIYVINIAISRRKVKKIFYENVGYTTRKLINTNRNIEGIFPSVNFREILPTKIFPRYIPRELPWENKLKQSKKKMMTYHFYQWNYRRNLFRR
jgi:hypothetical protein